MGSAVLGDAIGAIRDWSITKGKKGKAPASLPTGAGNGFGSLAFGDSEQQKRLPKAAYQALRKTIAHGESLDPSVADAVAKAVKDWAVEHGATHYTHWFQPLTGITAEKHDSFLNPTADGKAVAESEIEAVRIDAVAHLWPVDLALHQPGFAEDRQVLGDGRLREVKLADKFAAHARLARAAVGVREWASCDRRLARQLGGREARLRHRTARRIAASSAS